MELNEAMLKVEAAIQTVYNTECLDSARIKPLEDAVREVLEATPVLGRYHAKWFSGVDWAYRELDLIAANEAQVWAHVETVCSVQFRSRPYRGANQKEEDSLVVERTGDVTLPYEL